MAKFIKAKKFKQPEMVAITIGDEVITAGKEVSILYDLLKEKDIEVKTVEDLLRQFATFNRVWEQVYLADKFRKNQKNIENLPKVRLVHSIKRRTQYYSQQEKTKSGGNVLYPINRITEFDIHSSSPGGNYPIKECDIFYVSDSGKFIKIN